MKIPVIKQLCENHDLQELEKAELDLIEEKDPEFEIPGDDEGEKLTHVMAAIWIKSEMKNSGCDIREAIRNYSQRVRKSIS